MDLKKDFIIHKCCPQFILNVFFFDYQDFYFSLCKFNFFNFWCGGDDDVFVVELQITYISVFKI